jgi:hypothetical protein
MSIKLKHISLIPAKEYQVAKLIEHGCYVVLQFSEVDNTGKVLSYCLSESDAYDVVNLLNSQSSLSQKLKKNRLEVSSKRRRTTNKKLF